MICKCCANFMLLVVQEAFVLLDLASPSSWYVLYAPGATNPQLIYHRRENARYLGWSTKRTESCFDPQTHLVGVCVPYIGCVEDLVNSFGYGESGAAAGFSHVNNIAGRFKVPVRGLYDQRECYALIKHTGFFKGAADVQDTLLGRVILRPVPTSKLVPDKVFGQPFEFTWVDHGRVDAAVMSESLTVVSFTTKVFSAVDQEITMNVSGIGVAMVTFSKVVLGVVTVSPGFRQELRGKTIVVYRISLSSPSFVVLKITDFDSALPFKIN